MMNRESSNGNLALPATVVRFYGTVEFAFDVIRNGQIAFISPSSMNDPFDPYCFFETDFGDSYMNLFKYVKHKRPAAVPWFRSRVTARSWGKTVSEMKSYLERLKASMFILSTSAPSPELHPKDNLYMWGHYGSGHRGIAIEFDTNRTSAAVLKHHESENIVPLEEQEVWAKIEYVNTFSPIAAADVFELLDQERKIDSRRQLVRADTKLDVYYRRMSVIKNTVWKSENEWRLMWHNDTGGLSVYKCPISQDCVTNIFIGFRFSGDVSAFVAESKRAFPKAGIYRAKKRHGDLALDFEPL